MMQCALPNILVEQMQTLQWVIYANILNLYVHQRRMQITLFPDIKLSHLNKQKLSILKEQEKSVNHMGQTGIWSFSIIRSNLKQLIQFWSETVWIIWLFGSDITKMIMTSRRLKE